MENLVFSLNITIPVFALMLLGILFRKLGIMDIDFAKKINQFVFKIALPVLVFKDLAKVDLKSALRWDFVLFCFFVTVISILISLGISVIFVKKDLWGEFIQGSYRSSAALLGIAIIESTYGSSTMGPLMIVGSVPLYNIAAILVLSFFKEKGRIEKKDVKKAVIGILTNPILIGIWLGLIFSGLRLPFGGIPERVVNSIADLATPLGLMAMGATFDIKASLETKGTAILASFIKLCGFVMVFMPVAIYLGFRRDELIAILVMLGSATTVSSYVYATNMGHKGVLTSSVVMITTFFVGFSLTLWIFVLKSLGLL